MPNYCVICDKTDVIFHLQIILNFELEYNGEEVQPVLNTLMTPDRPVIITFKPRSLPHDG